MENTEENQLFSSKMLSMVCWAGGVGRCARAGETSHAVGETSHAVDSWACRKASTWVFAAIFLLLFSSKFMIPLFCYHQHRTGCCPHSLPLSHSGLSGFFASALSASFLQAHTLVWLCLSEGAASPPSWYYFSGTLEVLHSALKPFHLVFPFTAFSLSA